MFDKSVIATYTRAMEETHEDNVHYIELRTTIANVRTLKTMKNVAKRNIITTNPASTINYEI